MKKEARGDLKTPPRKARFDSRAAPGERGHGPLRERRVSLGEVKEDGNVARRRSLFLEKRGEFDHIFSGSRGNFCKKDYVEGTVRGVRGGGKSG